MKNFNLTNASNFLGILTIINMLVIYNSDGWVIRIATLLSMIGFVAFHFLSIFVGEKC